MTRLQIPHVPLLANRYRNLHWAAKRRETIRWGALIREASGRLRGPLWGKKPRAVGVRITVYRRRRQDPDNAVACLKPVLDALKQTGWISDDGLKWLHLKADEDTLAGRPLGEREPCTVVELGPCP